MSESTQVAGRIVPECRICGTSYGFMHWIKEEEGPPVPVYKKECDCRSGVSQGQARRDNDGKLPDCSEAYKGAKQKLTARSPGGVIEFRCEHCRYENVFTPSGRVYICYNCRQVLAVHTKAKEE